MLLFWLCNNKKKTLHFQAQAGSDCIARDIFSNSERSQVLQCDFNTNRTLKTGSNARIQQVSENHVPLSWEQSTLDYEAWCCKEKYKETPRGYHR